MTTFCCIFCIKTGTTAIKMAEETKEVLVELDRSKRPVSFVAGSNDLLELKKAICLKFADKRIVSLSSLLVAERLSARQLILHRISASVCIYVYIYICLCHA